MTNSGSVASKQVSELSDGPKENYVSNIESIEAHDDSCSLRVGKHSAIQSVDQSFARQNSEPTVDAPSLWQSKDASSTELEKLIGLRDALIALKGPHGNISAFRETIQRLLEDTGT